MLHLSNFRKAVIAASLLSAPFVSNAQWANVAPGGANQQYNTGNVGIGIPAGFSAGTPLAINGNQNITGGSSSTNRNLNVTSMRDFTIQGGNNNPSFSNIINIAPSGTNLNFRAGNGNNGGAPGNVILEPGISGGVLGAGAQGNVYSNQVRGSLLVGPTLASGFNPTFQRLVVGTGLSGQSGGRNNIGQWENGNFGTANPGDLWATLGGPGPIPSLAGNYGLRLNSGEQSVNFFLNRRAPGALTDRADVRVQWADNNTSAPQADFIFNFRSGPSATTGIIEVMRMKSSGRVGVNWQDPDSRLQVFEDVNDPSGITNSVHGLIRVNGNSISRGVWGQNFSQDKINIGVHGAALNAGFGLGPINIGVLGEVSGKDNTKEIAVFGNAFDFSDVTGTSQSGDPLNPNIFSATNQYNLAGYFNGVVSVSQGIYVTSDSRFKTNVKNLTAATDVLNRLKPRTYTYNYTKETGHIALPYAEKESVGFIAQELKEVAPNLVRQVFHPAVVSKDGKVIRETVDYEAVNYAGLTPYLVAAFQELSARVEKLEQEKQAQSAISTMRAYQAEDFALEQSVPNPTSGRATIKYRTPSNVASIEMNVFDLEGKTVRSLKGLKAGNETVEVDLSGERNGLYFYNLIVDGNEVALKRLLLSK